MIKYQLSLVALKFSNLPSTLYFEDNELVFCFKNGLIVLPTGSDVSTGDRNLIIIKTYNRTNFRPVENSCVQIFLSLRQLCNNSDA